MATVHETLPAPGATHAFPTIVGPRRDAERELVEHLAWLFCWADVQNVSLHDAFDQAENLFVGLADSEGAGGQGLGASEEEIPPQFHEAYSLQPTAYSLQPPASGLVESPAYREPA
jgi:hypothetical protein